MLNGLNVCFRLDAAKEEEKASLERLCWYNQHGMTEHAKAERRHLEKCRNNIRSALYSLMLYKEWLKS